MEIHDSYKKKFKEAFPKQTIHAIRAAFDLGYESVDNLYRNTSIANFLSETLIGIDIRADILRASLACSFKTFCYKGILPYIFNTPENTARNSHHIRLDSIYGIEHALYLARVEYPQEIPRSTLYRPQYDDIELSLFDTNSSIRSRVDTFTATYGDGGKHSFQYGNIGILGTKSWLYCEPLEVGVYRYTTDQENKDILVSLDEDLEKILQKGDKNNGGTK